MPAASWHTPSAPFQVTPASAPYQYYQATLAWSHRYEVNTLDYPRAMERVVLADHGWLNVQGDNDDSGLNMTGFVEPWGWVPNASFTFPSGGFVEPDETGNYVLIWDQAGGLSSGHYAQLWRNGVLVGYVTTQIPDYGLSNLRLLGEGSTVLAGETQGFWWSGDTAMDPATMFAELFDGANGMLDLNADPTIDGVTPDNYYMEPGAGGGGAVASGTADVTGAAVGTLRAAAVVSGTVGVTGAAAGTLRASATASGSASTSGAATASMAGSGAVASGTASVTGAASGTLRAAASATGAAGVTGASTGTLRSATTASGSVGVSGVAAGNVIAFATASGSADTTGNASGSTGTGTITAEATGLADVTGTATIFNPFSRRVTVSSRRDARGHAYWWKIEAA